MSVDTMGLIVVARFITGVVVPAVFGGLALAALANVALQTLASFVDERRGG